MNNNENEKLEETHTFRVFDTTMKLEDKARRGIGVLFRIRDDTMFSGCTIKSPFDVEIIICGDVLGDRKCCQECMTDGDEIRVDQVCNDGLKLSASTKSLLQDAGLI